MVDPLNKLQKWIKQSSRILRLPLLHLLFWIGVWFLYYYFFSYNSDDMVYVTWFSSLLLPIAMAVTYFTIYFLIPRFLLKKKYRQFVLYSFYMIVVSTYFIVVLIYGILILVKKWDAANIPPMVKNFFFILVLVYLVAGIVGFITILNSNFKTDKQNKDLQNKILNTQLQLREQELDYLKRQIHPHFLFNTLNTIYGFALKKSAQTPDIILKLSNLLDYILYQVNKPKVSLQEELQHIKEYLELERIRFSETLMVEFTSDKIDDKAVIAPMLIIPLVENAFKHGNIIDGMLKIQIRVNYKNDDLVFNISNTCLEQPSSTKKAQGIGIKNIIRRLEIHYPGRYKINGVKKGNLYHASLEINKISDIENVNKDQMHHSR